MPCGQQLWTWMTDSFPCKAKPNSSAGITNHAKEWQSHSALAEMEAGTAAESAVLKYCGAASAHGARYGVPAPKLLGKLTAGKEKVWLLD